MTEPAAGERELNVQETARRLGVHVNTVRNWDKAGILTASRRLPGRGFRRFRESDVEQLRQRIGNGRVRVMTEKRTAKPDVRFEVAITEEHYGGGDWYAKFIARVLVWGESTIDHKENLFAPDSYELPWEGRPGYLKGLVITAQSDTDHMRHAGEEFYGWHVGVDRSPHVIELADAEEIIKALRRITRGMEKLSREMGRPETLAQFATHAARTLTAEPAPFVRWVRGEDDYDGTGRRWMDANALSGWIHRECAELRKKRGIETAEG